MRYLLCFSLSSFHFKESCNFGMTWGFYLEVTIDYFDNVYTEQQRRNLA